MKHVRFDRLGVRVSERAFAGGGEPLDTATKQ